MILRILERKEGEAKLDKAFGITNARRNHLMSVVEQQIEAIEDNGGVMHLSRAYKDIAEACDTLEEYTMCMHTFIFFITQHGALATDPRFKN